MINFKIFFLKFSDFEKKCPTSKIFKNKLGLLYLFKIYPRSSLGTTFKEDLKNIMVKMFQNFDFDEKYVRKLDNDLNNTNFAGKIEI